ncbi:MAG: thioredoxin domain-containing protein, partial [Sphaerospermopsis sp. SIO1G2]|nr:thioredoxin domain-containing protein [Sphaerospermopsis sp. SIO1G2]
YLELAAKAANFILDNQFVDGYFHRLNYEGEATVLAQSEDYAFFIKALLDLDQADVENTFWLEKATSLQDEFNQLLWSQELGGYFNTSSNKDLIVKERSFADNSTPSANGVAIANLVRLCLLTDNLSYLDLAESGIKAFNAVMGESPQACPSLFTALDWYCSCTLVRSQIGQIRSLMTKYLPAVVFSNVSDLPAESVGLVCQGLQCLPAPGSLQELLTQVQSSQNRS